MFLRPFMFTFVPFFISVGQILHYSIHIIFTKHIFFHKNHLNFMITKTVKFATNRMSPVSWEINN